MIRSLSLLPLALLGAAISWAQAADTALKIPVLGYLAADSPVTVRPIVGAPGAMVLGSPLALPDGITRVVPVPGQQFAIVERADGAGSGVLALSLAGAANVTIVANTFSHSDRIAFSPSGSVAVLYNAAAQEAQIVSGLPSGAQLSRTVDLSLTGFPLVSIAVSDDAQVILAGFSDRSRGSIWSFVAGQNPQWVTDAGVTSALRFSLGSKTLSPPTRLGSKCCCFRPGRRRGSSPERGKESVLQRIWSYQPISRRCGSRIQLR